ncbi:MAG: hypothetical protein K6T80_00920 [Firmicutes bacterium]|nr:hypothetical protein [Bacillota bacterium]
MDRIKSAYEKALERFQQKKEVSAEEIARLEHLDTGKSIAAAYLRNSGVDLRAELGKQPDEIKKYIAEGIEETLLHNIHLPADESGREATKKALEGLFQIKEDKQSIGELLGQLEHLFNYYARSYHQTYQNFKEAFSAKLSSAVEKRTGHRIKLDPEKHPAFREEWMRTVAQLNAQYESLLQEQKERIKEIQ